jgi:hypothetical protein
MRKLNLRIQRKRECSIKGSCPSGSKKQNYYKNKPDKPKGSPPASNGHGKPGPTPSPSREVSYAVTYPGGTKRNVTVKRDESMSLSQQIKKEREKSKKARGITTKR